MQTLCSRHPRQPPLRPCRTPICLPPSLLFRCTSLDPRLLVRRTIASLAGSGRTAGAVSIGVSLLLVFKPLHKLTPATAKPCKFFHSNGMCVKGNRCNLYVVVFFSEPRASPHLCRSIHDQSQARRPSQSPVVGSPPTSRRRRAAKRAQARAEEAEQRTNFYPITWRVIGGGVMMGGQRTNLVSLILRRSF